MPTADVGSFEGFGPGLVEFYSELEDNNERTWWHANKDRYEHEVGQPMKALGAELARRYGPVKVFRPYRDVRFGADKRPVKEHAALAASPAGPALYLQVSADGLMLAGGWWRPERPQLDAFRSLVDDPAKARGLHRHLAGLEESGLEMAPPELKSAPRGFKGDHPEIDLLRRTSLTVSLHHDPGPWLSTPEALGRITEGWDAIGRWNKWLVDHLPLGVAPAVP